MKKNILRLILIFLLLWTFFIIFGFSNQNGEKSSDMSKTVTQFLIDRIPQINKLEGIHKQSIIQKIEKIVRKIAHFSIYTFVGVILMCLFSTYRLKDMQKLYFSSIIGIIYAISDEIHQSFIPGRLASVFDVIIDTMGVICGTLCVLLIIKIILNTKKNDNNLHKTIEI